MAYPSRPMGFNYPLYAVADGTIQLDSRNRTLFLEQLCMQQDQVTCLKRLLGSRCGFFALQSALYMDVSVSFLNGLGSKVLHYMLDDVVAIVGGADLLKCILTVAVEPTTLWDALVRAFRAGQLNENASVAFARLFFHLITPPAFTSSSHDFLDIAKDPATLHGLSSSPSPKVQKWGAMIHYVLNTQSRGIYPSPAYWMKDEWLPTQQITAMGAAEDRERSYQSQLVYGHARSLEQKRQEIINASSSASSVLYAWNSAACSVDPSESNLSARRANDPYPKKQSFSSAHLSGFEGTSQRIGARSSRKAPKLDRSAEEEWQRQKAVEAASNTSIDALMDMTGLANVKQQFLKIKDRVEIARRREESMRKTRLNVSMLGNPGTGKTTVARLYGQFLASIEAIPGEGFVETTGSKLANDGIRGAKQLVEELLEEGGGTLFCDEAYQLTSEHNYSGRQVLDFLLAEMENHVGTIVFIFAGYNREMEKFFEHNPGLASRIPYKLQFDDYKDHELMDMLGKMLHNDFQGRMVYGDPDGIYGLYGRIVIRRLGRGRGQPGFGNARDLSNLKARILERQAHRIREARKRMTPDAINDFLLTKEDIIGPEPSNVRDTCEAYKELRRFIGLNSIKQEVESLFDQVQMNYERELLELEPHLVSLNRVFLGNPGTGKTSVAKLYGQILAELGLISNGEVILKNPADFIGNAVGHSESQTKAILQSSRGKVLVIDEAYMLYGGSGSSSSHDSYRTSVIDTIVAEVQGVPGEDRCVLLLGYKRQMEEMFQNVNPGLARRFAIENAFTFEDYNDAELLQAIEMKMEKQDLTAADEAKRVAIEVLSRERNRPHFGNIGAVDNLLSQGKIRLQQRIAKLPRRQRSATAPLEAEDFDPHFRRQDKAAENLADLFKDVVGCEDIIDRLGRYQKTAMMAKRRGKDARELVPTNFIFKGPPGTGKTTTARKMGQVYFDMGFLSFVEVIECSASDLMGQYAGQTGPKTRQLFDRALGRVLFIDEAYRLGGSQYGKEAVDEMVGLLTRDMYRGKLIVVLAGYDEDMDKLLAVNTGLSSRFPDRIIFSNIEPSKCVEILRRQLAGGSLCVSLLEEAASPAYNELLSIFAELSKLPGWGNARDVQTLTKNLVGAAYADPSHAHVGADINLPVSADEILFHAGALLAERSVSAKKMPTFIDQSGTQLQHVASPIAAPAPLSYATRTVHKTVAKTPPPCLLHVAEPRVQRDPGVPDYVWAQLQRDQQAYVEDSREEQEVQEKLREMGVCEVGYPWIKQATGYRCAGGSHVIDNATLGI